MNAQSGHTHYAQRVNMKGKAATLAAIALVATTHVNVANAQTAKAINGRCGMAIGKLIVRNSGGSTYHFRWGPKHPGNIIKPGTCRGKVKVKRITGQRPNGSNIVAYTWMTYAMLHFKMNTALRIATGSLTVYGCTVVGRTMVTAIDALVTGATDGVALPLVATSAGALGCGIGAHTLYSWLPDGPWHIDGVRVFR